MAIHAVCLVNSSQGKDAGVLFILNYSIHRHTGTRMLQVLDRGTIFNFAKVNSSLHACSRSLFRTASRQAE